MCQHVYYRSVETLFERPSGHVPVCASLNCLRSGYAWNRHDYMVWWLIQRFTRSLQTIVPNFDMQTYILYWDSSKVQLFLKTSFLQESNHAWKINNYFDHNNDVLVMVRGFLFSKLLELLKLVKYELSFEKCLRFLGAYFFWTL